MEISKEWPDDLPKHKHGHYFINKDLIEYYLNTEIEKAKFPDFEKKIEVGLVGLEGFMKT